MRKLKFLLILLLLYNLNVRSANMSDYCYVPPFLASSIPSLVMLVSGKDHKLYYEAYNDASDLDEDGKLDVGYKHSIDYYGYFDPYKCYKYQNSRFEPIRKTNNKYCGGSGEWSGNFLNWLTMARIDVLRKVLYGGYRLTDSASETVLEATFIPQDAHSWGKEYSGTDTNLLTPFNPPSSNKRHLFCITSTSDGDTRKIRVLQNKSNRIWEWASKERPVCNNNLGTPSEYYIRVKVCDPSVGLEPNCKRYPGGGGTYKPIGLLQKYGEGDGSKWCSKTLKPCQTNNDCGSNEGLCVDKGQMYFGLITGSYEKNMSGGVLRKNIWSIVDETNANTGIFQSSENTPGNIILTFDRLKIVDFNYNGHSYAGGWVTTRPMIEGEFKNWGNPVGEMLYEALRYFAGKTSPTSSFTYSGNQDGGINLPKPNWGKFTAGGNSYKLYDIFPICAKPFVITLSDINNSYDSDSVPGSSFNSFSGDLSMLNVSALADTISSVEGISGNYFIGQSSSFYDFICSAKSMSSLATIRGLCPEEPTKQGSFYVASLAYYGNKKSGGWRDNFSGAKPSPIKTFSVALASPIPDIAVKIGGKLVRINLLGKSVSGCLNVYSSCAQKCSLTYSGGKLNITNCQSNAYCPTNQIVDFYVDTVNYDSDGNLTYAKFRINFEDVEQGADHDMDAIVEYEIQPVGANQIKVKLTSSYAAGCIDQVLGFNISGTTEDGTWLVVKDKDANTDRDTPAVVGGMPLTWERTFTVTGSTAGQLKPPLWYAAKWGGFDDINGNEIPDLPQEWDKDGDGKPDTYFYVVNPLKLERELEKAFTEILKRASSGSTVATLSTKTSISSLMIQPFFFSSYTDSAGRDINWIGFSRSYWVDPKNDNREDTNSNKVLNLDFDKIFQIYFDTNNNQTKAAILTDTSTCTSTGTKDLVNLIPVFDSGCWLGNCNPSDRRIYYYTGSQLKDFTTSNYPDLKNIWDLVDDNSSNSSINDSTTQCIIRFLRGEDLSSDSTCSSNDYVKRNMKIKISDICPGLTGDKIWKLGDTITSTPAVVSNEKINNYDYRYQDSTYYSYVNSDDYKNRPSILIQGANDGMLHFFRMGTIIDQSTTDPDNPVKLQNSPTDSGTNLIAKEEFAFIPKNAIPYLLWYGRKDYCHVPTLDSRVIVFDASINGNSNDYKTPNSWRTIVIGTMGFGGKALTAGTTTYSSSIFALDITDWLKNPSASTPTVLWEITLPDNTLVLSYPSIIRLGDATKNGNWYVVVGTGPNDPKPDSNSKFVNNPKIYFFDLKTGNKVNEISIPLPNNTVAAVGDTFPVDVDNDYSDDTIYFGLYGLKNQENVWNNWGQFYRLVIKNGLSSASLSNAVNMKTFNNNNQTPPITAAPNFTKDENGNLWVFFGTGRYLTEDDKTLSYKNYFIGFKDPCWNGSCNTTFTKSDFTDTTNENIQATITQIKQMCICDSSGCSNRDVVYSAKGNTPAEVAKGWYKELTNEGVISQSLVFGSIIDFMTFIPPNDICAYEGNSKLYALYYKSGTAYPNPAILSPNAVTGTISVGQTVTVNPSINLGVGIPPRGNPFQVSVSQNSPNTYEKFIQISSGVVVRQSQQPITGKPGFILWIEK